MKQITTTSEKQTFNLAKKFAKQLKGGEIIGLIGELGAGKTIFTKGLAAGLGIKKNITSPTFVLMKIYPIRHLKSDIRNFVHIDAYRIKTAQDLIAIGGGEYFNRPDAITVIEWADKIKKILPKNAKIIKIENKGNDKRKFIISK
ncbi:tRNA (adenosine(37)-N6)-threonylcarbamoyltransferase complex ATPase subunit type 1 TsaE [Candidatus Parcubacteria bacterium]|nr:tRNA (adenosine(37)-N6)-threonylcarbamoyltransferase complex ATPase subunit type 1 TsaE [Candidatus Parcubacteria bacterium]